MRRSNTPGAIRCETSRPPSTSGPIVSFGYSDSEGGATFEVRLDGGSWTSAASPHSYSSLSDGSHTFDVRALDAYGNTSGATSRTWTVDATAPPAPSIDSGPAASSTSGPIVTPMPPYSRLGLMMR